MRVAAAAYPMDFLDSWLAYEQKLTRWVSEAASAGADLLVFPEYGAMELATLAGRDTALDLEASLHAVSERIPDETTIMNFRHLLETQLCNSSSAINQNIVVNQQRSCAQIRCSCYAIMMYERTMLPPKDTIAR